MPLIKPTNVPLLLLFVLVLCYWYGGVIRARDPMFLELEINYPKAKYTPKPFNDAKVALLMEKRPLPVLTPLLLHFLNVIPPDWTFRFLGSEESRAHLNRSAKIREYQGIGKLSLDLLPANVSIDTEEDLSQTLTNYWFYDTVLYPAEWLFIFQADSIVCANSQTSLNHWVDRNFSWVGASWGKRRRWGGNGGLSLRKVSSIKRILEHQTRFPGEKYEDWWLTDRLAHIPGEKMANGTESLEFSVEVFWHPRPMAYHAGDSGETLMVDVWGDKDHRDQIYEYCPEIKMILPMVLQREVQCQAPNISFTPYTPPAGESGE